MNFRYLHTFDNVYQLDLVRSKFRAEGIEFVVDDEFVTQIGYAHASGGAKIRVPEPQWSQAKSLLQEMKIYVDQRNRLSKFDRKLWIYTGRTGLFDRFNLLERKLILLFFFAVIALGLAVSITLLV